MIEKIIHIKQKLQLLIKQYKQLQKENFQLKNQTEKQSFLLKEQKRSIELLQQKKDIEQIQTSQLSKQDKAVLEKRIDGYLKEVNMCLSLLNKE